MTGCRHMKSKLQFLSKVFCDRDIQSLDRMGHDPNEDASASMELVLLKMGKGLKYGDSCSGGCWDGPSKEKILSVMSDSIVSLFIFYFKISKCLCFIHTFS